MHRIPENEASLVESVLLFTDGRANVGIRAQAPLVKATRSVVFTVYSLFDNNS